MNKGVEQRIAEMNERFNELSHQGVPTAVLIRLADAVEDGIEEGWSERAFECAVAEAFDTPDGRGRDLKPGSAALAEKIAYETFFGSVKEVIAA